MDKDIIEAIINLEETHLEIIKAIARRFVKDLRDIRDLVENITLVTKKSTILDFIDQRIKEIETVYR